MPTPSEARHKFTQAVRRRDSEIDLLEASLLIAAGLGSDPSTDMCRAQVGDMARRVDMLLKLDGVADPRSEPLRTVGTINQVIFEEERFSGNRENYYDLENSFVDRVLVRRTGIPITLSIVYMEVARQVGFPMQGIGLPGHFVTGYWSPDGDKMPLMIVDPFSEGQLLTPDDCAARVHAAYGDDVRFTPEWLQPMSRRQILYRVLSNLKQIYMAGEQFRDALHTVDMLLAVQPDAIWELKERGLLYYRTGTFILALADLRRYLKLAPDGEENHLLKYYIELLRRLVASSN
jgi:regulator of sirC expression with transglutaminase-like and TPR domain